MMVLIISVFLGGCTKTKVAPTPPTTAPTPTITVKDLTWNDEAGFTFTYPENVKITPDASDNNSYANLTTSDGVKIMAVDSKYKDIQTWAKNETVLTEGTIMEASISGKSAKKKVMVNGATIVGIIDDKILFTIQAPEGKSSFDQIVRTFTLVYPTAKPDSGSGGNGGSEVELEEETVE